MNRVGLSLALVPEPAFLRIVAGVRWIDVMTPLQTLQVMHHLVQQHRTVKEVLQRLQTIVEVDLAPTRVVA